MKYKIPLIDLKKQNLSIKKQLDDSIKRILNSLDYISAKEVETFEEEFADYMGSKYCVGVASGTSALLLSLLALEVGIGDEVILPSHTFFATAEAVSLCGATPIFVDIDQSSYCVDSVQIQNCITSHTKAIIPVHLYGLPANLSQIVEIASKYNIHIIEDGSQAHGAKYNNKKVGTFGKIGCFSFYPSKNLGAMGDAGAVITDDKNLAAQLRKLRNHGRISKYEHDLIGTNSRMDEMQAAILRVKLPLLDTWNELRVQKAFRYISNLRGSNVIPPLIPPDRSHVFHLFVIRSDLRSLIQSRLSSMSIETGIHYPIPIHKQRPFMAINQQYLPVTEKIVNEILSIPLCPFINDDIIDRISSLIIEQSGNRLFGN